MKNLHDRKARIIREKLGLTQIEVAQEIEVDRSLISHFEAGRAAMSTKRLQRLAEYYSLHGERITMEDLLAEVPEPAPAASEVKAAP